jgi:glycosyltransferase 2 family protein
MKNKLLAVVKAALSVALVVWILRSLDVAALGAAVRRLTPATLGAAALLVALQAVIIGWRWHRIVALLGGRLMPGDAVAWVFVGMFFNSALPTSVGGDAVRVWLLRRSGAPLGLSLGSVAIERGSGIVVLGLMVSACVPAIWAPLGGEALGLTLASIGPILLAGLVVAAVADKLVVGWIPHRLTGALRWLGDGLRRLATHPRALAEVAVLGVAASLTGLLAAYVLGEGLGIGLGLPAYIVLVGGSVLLSVLPISLGGWGVRELGMVTLFGAVGGGAEQALALSLLWGLLPLLVSLPAGLLWRRRGAQPERDDELQMRGSALPPKQNLNSPD